MKRALLIGLLVFGMNAQAKTTEPVEEKNKTAYHCHFKAEYYAIRADYEGGKISIKQAQRKWQKAKERLIKEEAS